MTKVNTFETILESQPPVNSPDAATPYRPLKREQLNSCHAFIPQKQKRTRRVLFGLDHLKTDPSCQNRTRLVLFGIDRLKTDPDRSCPKRNGHGIDGHFFGQLWV